MKINSRSVLKWSLTLVAASVLSACSQLSVQVDVLRPEVVSSHVDADALARIMPAVVAEDDLSVERVFAELQQTHFDAYQDIADKYASTAKALPEESEDRRNLEIAAESLRGGVTPELKEFYRRKEQEVKVANALLRRLWGEYQASTDVAVRGATGKRLLSGIAERQALLSSVYTMIGHDLDSQLASSQIAAATVAPATIVNAEARVRHSMKQLFDGGGLIDSRFTYHVVSAMDDDWAPMFDRTLARGIFGNTDIAIKALGPGNFTIKGLSFNPADVAAAASRVATQSVLLAAQIAGVPVKVSGTPAAGSSGAALAQSSNAFSQVLSQSTQMNERVTAHRDALLRIAAGVLQERKTIVGGTDAERKASLQSIKAIYSSHAARLAIANP